MKPPKNFRAKLPHCCATCESLVDTDDNSVCARNETIEFNQQYQALFSVCDRWKASGLAVSISSDIRANDENWIMVEGGYIDANGI